MSADLDKYLKIKDFYELLGVNEQATPEEIKKSYRKLALKFHPDKHSEENKEKAKEVFKKIAQAYDCLSDKDKRAFYDRHGTDDPQQHYQQQYSSQDISPDDIFNMFFGGMPGRAGGGGLGQFFEEMARQGGQGGFQQNGNTFYFSSGFPGGFGGGTRFRGRQQQHEDEDEQEDDPRIRYQNQRRRQQQQPQQKKSTLVGLCQLLPLFIILFSGYFKNLFKEEAAYQLEYSYYYSDFRATQKLQAPYYVNEKYFDKNIAGNRQKFFDIERQIEVDYVEDLRDQCSSANHKIRYFKQQSKLQSDQKDKDFFIKRANQISKDPCIKLDKLKEEHKDLDKFRSD